MQNKVLNFPTEYWTTTISGGNWVVTGPTSSGTQPDSFGFSGFGPNPDPKKRLPVAGAYDKMIYTAPKGTFLNAYWDFNQQRYTNGVIYDGTTGQHGSLLLNLSLNYDSNVYNEALSKLWDSIKQTESNLALTIGEWRETAKMLRVGESVYQVLTSLRKAKRDFLRNPSRSLSSWWLSYQYGWRPAITDVYNYVNWTYHAFDSMKFSARRRKTKDIAETQSTPYGGAIKSRITGEQVWQCEFGVMCGVSDPAWFTASRITSMNPLSIAWELVPLSFVFDWFYDVGSYLENLENALGTGLAFQGGYVTELCRINGEDRWSGTNILSSSYPSWEQRLEIKDTNTLVRTIKRRQVLGSFPLPRLPCLKVNLGSSRILSATALTRTIVLGGVKGKKV
jgi:hypothetical protein